MQGTIDGFHYGLVTPVAGYIMACLGAALGLRCTVRSLRTDRSWKPGWLALGAAAIGCGIWTMHFIAMLGFQVQEVSISYDAPLTVLSLLVAVVVVAVGVFMVGYRGTSPSVLVTAGVLTGLGVAAMHYLGMAAMQVDGEVEYDPLYVALSIVIAIGAATAARWAAVSIRGFHASLGASVIMGLAVTGMHYTGMAAVSVRVDEIAGPRSIGGSPAVEMLPMLIGPLSFLMIAGVIVMFDPMLIMGDDEAPRGPRTERPAVAGATAGLSRVPSRTPFFDEPSAGLREVPRQENTTDLNLSRSEP